MNHSANTNEQQGEPSWATENWDNPGALGSLDHPSRQYTGPSRLEWDWDPMILAQHPGSGASNDGNDGDRINNQISAGTMSLRHPYNMLPTGLPSNFNPHNPTSIFNTPGIRNFGPLDGSGHLSSSSNLHSVLGSGIPGLAATSLDNDIRNYDQRRREFYPGTGIHDHHVKREETSDGHARIGLNLGVRTYFSTEDTAAGRLGKRHRAGSPGSQVPMCQAEGCKADLSTAKQYHRRHKVCENHSKAGNVIVAGHTQRFCQQCSRFHLLGEFDDGKRSCRKRLADHNRRRRKPQPNASQPSAESIGMKSGDDDRANDQKSMLLNIKKSGSPSSVSLEDSDEKPGSAGNNLHLRTSGPGFGRGLGDEQRSSHSGMQMSSQPMTGSQSLLNTMSHSPPHILQIPKRHHTMSMSGTGNHGQDHAIYHQQYLQGVNSGQTGPNLSLSSLGGSQLGLSHQPGGRGQPVSNQLFGGMDSTVPWLSRTNNLGRSDLRADGLTQVVGRSGLQHLMATDSKSGITSASANSPSSQEHDVQVFSPSNQSLLPLQTSRDIASSEWMLGSMTGGQTPRAGLNHFGHSSSLNNLAGTGHQMLSLIETSNHNAGSNQSGQGARTQMDFMQQHNAGADSGGDNNSRGGGSTVDSPDLKYHDELQPLRNYGPSSIYDSHNLLSGHYSYETMV